MRDKPPINVNPDILAWARTTAGLSLERAADALGFRDTRKRAATERLRALEAGTEEPSRSVLLKMAKAYRRSLLVFYLKEHPRKGDRGQDFRTLPGAELPHYNPLLDALIRDLRGRQAIVRAVAEETDAHQMNLVGAASMDEPPATLAGRIVERLQFSLEEFRNQNTPELAFNYLRHMIEDAGVYVLLLGNLGTHHTNIPVEIFRGFAIADPVAPFLVINDQDARTAWAFTALHELTHLWLGTTGVSGDSLEAQIERFCNDVAGEILLPAAEMRTLLHVRSMSLAESIAAVTTFANARNVSRAMVAYKLLRAGTISDKLWQQLDTQFKQESRRRKTDEDRTGGPSYYVVRRHRLGNALLGFVRRSLGEGAITHTKAGQVLGVKPRNVEPLLEGVSLQGSR